MATWIVHLRIAETLLEQIPGLEAEKFALGSVAPDSGKPDARWENFTPPPMVTHFQEGAGPQHYSADLNFYRKYLQPLASNPAPRLFSFRLGYFFHIVTDNLWSIRIGRPTIAKYKAQFDADKDFIWIVKKDWYGLDFLHVRDHAGCIFWRAFCSARPERGELDFLVPESLAWSVAHIQEYYQRTDEETQKAYNRPYVYLTQAEADRFVDEAVQLLLRIYKRLWLEHGRTEGMLSALDLPLEEPGN